MGRIGSCSVGKLITQKRRHPVTSGKSGNPSAKPLDPDGVDDPFQKHLESYLLRKRTALDNR